MQCETLEPPVEAAAVDDPIARMNQLMSEHRAPLLRYLTRLTTREHSAEDFVQETMCRAWRHLSSVPSDTVGQRRWLFVVGRRVVIDAIRRGGVRPVEVGPAESSGGPYTDETAGIAIAGHTLRETFAELSRPHQQVLSEIYFNGASLDETAERLQVPVGTVKSRTHYALAILRRSLLAA
jgi:RNA polymerase sigma-70 factor (ECF subfamily)